MTKFPGSLLSMLALIAGCAGAELPDAPDPPRRTDGGMATPPPDNGSTLPATGPRQGVLASTPLGWLEVLEATNQGRLVRYVFLYDKALAGITLPASGARATWTASGATTTLKSFNESSGGLLFYAFPDQRTPSGSSVTLNVTAGTNGWTTTLKMP
ncbi:MAG: hypothetical protein VKP57_03965 [Candidatus Sericytochromatia bacterium]|nr:hypothetical protein [Candidatus Sericytochromatia bacterium]